MSWSGMTYLASNFWGCLLAATLLGFGLAWWLRGSGIGRKLSAFEAEWSRKLGLAHEESSRLSMQVKEATGHVGDWTSKFATLAAEHDTLRTSFADISGKIPVLETAIAGWAANSAMWDTDRGKLQADLKACADARGQLQLDLDAWTAKAKAWDTERANFNAEWEKKLATAATRTMELEGNVNEWKTRFTALDGDHGKLKTSFADVSGEIGPLEGLVAGWVAKSTLWDTDRSKLQSDFKLSREARAKLEAQISDLNARLSATDAQLKKAIADDKAGDSAYEKTIADLRGRVSLLDTEKVKLAGDVTAALAARTALEADFTNTRGKLEAQITDLTARLNSSDAQLRKSIAADKADDTAYEKTITDLRGRMATIEGERTTLAGQLTVVNTDLKNAAATRARLEAQAADLTARLDKAIADDKADDVAYEKTIVQLRGRVSGLETEQQNWRTRYTSLEAEHSGCATKYATLESRLVMTAAAGSSTTTTTRKGGDIEDIQGIGPVYGGKLRKAGISWIRELLERGASKDGRAEIVEKTGLDADKVLTWVNHADLLRIEGVTPDWAELLEASGVDTVKELRNRVAENLHQKMVETNPNGPTGRYAPTVPELADVRKWVEKAKTMEPRVTH